MDGFAIFNLVISFLFNIYKTSSFWHSLGLVSTSLGRLSSFEVGFLSDENDLNYFNPIFSNKFYFSYFCNVDEIDFSLYSSNFIVYQGFFKSDKSIFSYSDLILPVMTYTEKTSSYLNLEGRLRIARKAIFPFKYIFSDWSVIRGLYLCFRGYILNNFSKISDFYYITAFFFRIIYCNCYFVVNLRYTSKEFFYISGFSLDKSSNLNLNLFAPLFFKLLSLTIFDKFIYNSILNRIINNYYNFDIFCKNSRTMTLSSLKVKTGNFSYNLF